MTWRESAICAGVDTDLFFPSTKAGVDQARRICKVCPVRQECLQFAVEHDPWGIWAGTTRGQRRAIAREQADPQATVSTREQRRAALAAGRAVQTEKARARLDELAVLLDAGEFPERAVERMGWSIDAALKSAERQKRKDISERLNPLRRKRKGAAA